MFCTIKLNYELLKFINKNIQKPQKNVKSKFVISKLFIKNIKYTVKINDIIIKYL